MELLLVNLASSKRVSEGGREYLVAPLTLIVPGVLAGSQGPLYYPPGEIEQTVKAWNDIPITLRHPRKDGNLVSAKDGGVRLGTIRNARYEDKLVADAWFDVAALNEQGPQLLGPIESGVRTEISTGLYTDNKPVKNGEHNGRTYTHVATNYRPDHLAILPDETGACSVNDGCGVNVNQTKKEDDMPLTKEQREKMVGNLLECCWEETDQPVLEKLTDNQLTRLSDQAEETKQLTLVANTARETLELPKDLKINQMPEALKKAIAAKAKKKGDDEEEEEENVETKNKKKKTDNAAVPPKPPTEEEWLTQAPEEVRSDLAFARNEKAKQRSAAIGMVTANLQGDDKTKVEKHLDSLSLEQIKDMAVLAPKPRPVANYGTVPPTGNEGQKEIPMGCPTWDFTPAAS